MYPEKCSRLLLVLWWRFMKPKYSWPYRNLLLDPVLRHEYSPQPLILCLRPTLMLASHLRFGLASAFPTNTFPFLPCALHVLYISSFLIYHQLICVDVYQLLSSSLFTSVLIFLSLKFSRSAQCFYLEVRLVILYVLPSEWQKNIRIF